MTSNRPSQSTSAQIAEEKRRIAMLKAEIHGFQENLAKVYRVLPASVADFSEDQEVDTNSSQQVLVSLEAKLKTLVKEKNSNLKIERLVREHYLLFESTLKNADAFEKQTQAENDEAMLLLATAANILKR